MHPGVGMLLPRRGFAAVALLALVASCAEGSGNDIEDTCTGSSALEVDTGMKGWSLPPKTLALTFDDGPGARTAELADWLHDRGIRAGWFVNGFHIWDPPVLDTIVADGHLLGNHTQDHKSFTGHATNTSRLSDWQIQDEITQTDALIAGKVDHDRFLLRPPYGDWDATSYNAVKDTAMGKYVGPVLWNIGDKMGPNSAADWDCWQWGNDGKILTVEQCGDLYVKEIDSLGRGIVLMHDFYFINNDPSQGGTVDMVKYIVPILLAKGYAFVRVDEVPEIAAQLPPLPAPPTPDDAGAPDASSSMDASTTATPRAPARSTSKDPATKSGNAGPASGDKGVPCRRSPQDSP